MGGGSNRRAVPTRLRDSSSRPTFGRQETRARSSPTTAPLPRTETKRCWCAALRRSSAAESSSGSWIAGAPLSPIRAGLQYTGVLPPGPRSSAGFSGLAGFDDPSLQSAEQGGLVRRRGTPFFPEGKFWANKSRGPLGAPWTYGKAFGGWGGSLGPTPSRPCEADPLLRALKRLRSACRSGGSVSRPVCLVRV